MSNFKVNWKAVHHDLNSMGGWANDPAAPHATNPDAGKEPIANRPECWTTPFKVPEWLRDKPEPDHHTRTENNEKIWPEPEYTY